MSMVHSLSYFHLMVKGHAQSSDKNVHPDSVNMSTLELFILPILFREILMRIFSMPKSFLYVFLC